MEYNLYFNIKSLGKVLFVLTIANLVVSCGAFSNQSRSSSNSAEINFDLKPKILDISTSVIWDGNETLGGNWVSHPDISKPKRVLIKNNSNGQSVVGAVFQQTKTVNKSSAKISSDAAKALGIVKNKESKVQIVAISVIENSKDNADGTPENIKDTKNIEPKLKKPFVQVGIFGVQNNADKTQERMDQLGLSVNTFEFEIKGKSYWRVVAGPAHSLDSQTSMLKVIKSAGFTDAYFVSN